MREMSNIFNPYVESKDLSGNPTSDWTGYVYKNGMYHAKYGPMKQSATRGRILIVMESPLAENPVHSATDPTIRYKIGIFIETKAT